MQRILSTLAAALILTLSVAVVAQAQEYPQGTTAQQPVDQQTTPQQTTPEQTTPVDPTVSTSTDLPRTASPLPLVGLGGLVSLAAGAWLARSRRRA